MTSPESPEQPKLAIKVEKLWVEGNDRNKYRFEITASQEDLFKILDSIRKIAAESTDQREIAEFLGGDSEQLNFGVYRFYYEPKENKMFALINGGRDGNSLNEEYGPKLERFLETFRH